MAADGVVERVLTGGLRGGSDKLCFGLQGEGMCGERKNGAGYDPLL
jgi:hypothetical protein